MTARFSAVFLCGALCSIDAWAQSNLTLYGTIGAVLRNTTHTDPGGKSKTETTGPNLAANWWGVRASEALGDALEVHVKLESGFAPDTGIARNAALFGREASVGIDSRIGKLDLGRLQVTGNASEALVRADPARGAGQIETVWPGMWSGDRYDNAVRYRVQFGSYFVGAQVSLGEQAAAAAGRTSVASAGFVNADTTVVAALQRVRDASGLASKVLTVGATHQLDGLTLHGAFMHATREKGFVVGTVAGSALFNTDLSFAGIKAPADQDTDFYLLGVTVPLAGRWTLRSALFYANSRHATLFSASHGGTQRTLYGVLSYALSKRSSLLVSVDANIWRDGWGGFWGASSASLAAYKPDGRDTRRSASVGMISAF